MPGITRTQRKSKLVAAENLSKINQSQLDSSMEETMTIDQAAAAELSAIPGVHVAAGDSDADFEAETMPIQPFKRKSRKRKKDDPEHGQKRSKKGKKKGELEQTTEGGELWAQVPDQQQQQEPVPKVIIKRKKDNGSDEGSLFEIVKLGKTALQSVVDDWIESYKADRDAALLELIQFFIQCSGCRGKITPHMYAELQHAELIRKMTEEFDEESGDYPLIMSGPVWKKFKANFCEFVTTLVRQCQYSIIYDQYMMDNIISLLTGLTDSQVRAFRHTSTLAAMKLMSALVDVALNLSINLDNTQRQYDAERQKNQNKRASERLEMLMAKRQELEDNQEEIRNMLTYIFKGVFVHRYRDTQGEIRNICLSEIGVWMRKYPNMFLDDSYLKYVGWTLYDRSGEVRHGCLKCLHALYESEELAPKLELFTNRFKDRIVEMTLDKEYDVAVAAVKLVISILKFNEQVLSDKDCENVYELVYSSHRLVAQAAGEFLNAKLFQKDEDAVRNLRTKKGKKRSENTPLIRDLVQFFIESELHEHGAYLVDSLWEINDMMKDWECMTDLLLEEPGRGEEPLDDRQETSLIEIMVCCVKQAATGESPVGRGPNKKLTARENKQIGEDKQRLTEHFIVALPQLVVKYIADDEKIANLLQIPQHFDLDIFTTSRLEKHLDTLLRHISEIVDKHTNQEVLEVCAKCFETFCNDDYAIARKCHLACNTLLDTLVERYKEAFQDLFHEEEADDDEAYAMEIASKKIYAFFGCHDLTNRDLWDNLHYIIKKANENASIPEEVVCKAIGCCSLTIMWKLYALDNNNPDKNAMKMVRKLLSELMGLCTDLLYHQQDKVNEEAFVTICDLLIVFSKHMGNNPILAPLIYEPDKNLQAQLSGFLTEKVFVDDEDDDVDENVKIEELHNRRNFLASFCKLVVYNVVHIRTAADMFKYYMKFYNDYGDIIKATLSKAREINKVSTAKTLALSLIKLFKDVQEEQGVMIDRSSEGYQQIKELARRFSLSFGLDQIKNREAVAAMHKEGIIFGLANMESADDPNGPPPNLAFLEILCEFTSKLMKQDKKTVVNYLDRHLAGGMPSSRSEDWAPLLTYRNSLVQGESDLLNNPLMKNPPGRPKSKSTRGRRYQVEDVGVTPHLPPPQLQSTMMKRARLDPEIDDHSSTHGSERDFDETSVALTMSQMSQASWLSSQKRAMESTRLTEPSYSRRDDSNLQARTRQKARRPKNMFAESVTSMENLDINEESDLRLDRPGFTDP